MHASQAKLKAIVGKERQKPMCSFMGVAIHTSLVFSATRPRGPSVEASGDKEVENRTIRQHRTAVAKCFV